jgi:hypothetical protein
VGAQRPAVRRSTRRVSLDGGWSCRAALGDGRGEPARVHELARVGGRGRRRAWARCAADAPLLDARDVATAARPAAPARVRPGPLPRGRSSSCARRARGELAALAADGVSRSCSRAARRSPRRSWTRIWSTSCPLRGADPGGRRRPVFAPGYDLVGVSTTCRSSRWELTSCSRPMSTNRDFQRTDDEIVTCSRSG